MKRRMNQLWLLVIADLLYTGCRSPVHIIYPPDQSTVGPPCVQKDPVTQVKVTFDSNFDPSSALSLTLDGQTLTNFQPAPAPGGTSVVPIQNAYTGGGQYDSCQIWRAHVLKADDSCGFFCVYPTVTTTFVPPHLCFDSEGPLSSPINLSASATTPTQAYVAVTFAPSNPILVTISETTTPNKVVSLGLAQGNMLPPGTPITVTIPTNTNRAYFLILGITPYPQYNLSAVGAGCQVGSDYGSVSK